MKSIIEYYRNNGTEVYSCLLDASKAFDRIQLDILFQILLDRYFPAKYISLLLDMYLNQDIQVKWGKDTSNAFGGVNGVRQGGVLSPILFTVYLDMLISELKSCGAGCWLGHHYYGGLVSADDISLLSPSVTGLQRMVDVCAKFGLKYSILFNEKKSVCIKYSADQDDLPDIILNGKVLKWEMKVKHLGNVLNNRLTDIDDILLKKQQFFQQANKVKSDFQGVRWDVLTQLFTKYCSSFYCSQSWN